MSLQSLPQAPDSQAANLSPAEARRVLRVRLLRDLVSHGLYRVPTRQLAEKLVPVVRGQRSS